MAHAQILVTKKFIIVDTKQVKSQDKIIRYLKQRLSETETRFDEFVKFHQTRVGKKPFSYLSFGRML